MDKRMENFNNEEIAVLNQVLELLPTMQEGMDYSRDKLKESKAEECIAMFGDLIEAFEGVEESILPLLNKLEAPDYMKKHDHLKERFADMVKEYESNQGTEAHTLMEDFLYPAFIDWKEELEENLRPLVAS